MIVTSFAIGIIVGFIFFEISGLTAGGIIVPGYLALFINNPDRLFATLFISLLTFGVVYLLTQYFIIFGRRRFFIMILIGFILRWIFDSLNIYLPENTIELQAIGYIIPGLIANEFFKQGIIKTFLAMSIVVSIVYLFLSVVYF